jgi:hypothetical protein
LILPRDRLSGWSIGQLVNEFGGGGLKWLTGSTVWLPAVFFESDLNTDLDIVFEDKDACELFTKGVLSALPGYKITKNSWGGSVRIEHPDGKHVIDAWYLEDDESIAELLLTYPSDYQRCAYNLTWSGPSPGHLTRIVKKRERIRETRSGYGRI